MATIEKVNKMNKAFNGCKLTNSQISEWRKFYKRQEMFHALLARKFKDIG
jgi:hypothetical protein